MIIIAIGIAGSNPARGMMCVRVFSVLCCPVSVEALALDWSPVQGVLPTVQTDS
jgi:hypothetical protein